MRAPCIPDTMGSRAGIVQDETACLNYIQWQDDFIKQKPYEIISQCPSDLQERNFTLKPGPAQTIHDIRGREGDFDLDRNGFRVQPHAFTTKVFDKETIERDYLPAVETLLKSAIDTSGEVRIFDWRVRYTGHTTAMLDRVEADSYYSYAPAHNDHRMLPRR